MPDDGECVCRGGCDDAGASLFVIIGILKIRQKLKEWIKKRDFLLSQPVTYLPGPETGYNFKPLKERLIE